MRAYNTCEIIERDRQIRSTGVGYGLSKNDIRTFASEAYDQLPTLPRSDLRVPLTGNHGLVRSPTMEKRVKDRIDVRRPAVGSVPVVRGTSLENLEGLKRTRRSVPSEII